MWTFIILAALCVSASLGRTTPLPCANKCKHKTLDISLIMDSSGSISGNNFTSGLWFLQDFVEQFDIGANEVRVSMLTYGNKVYTQDAFGFNSYTNKGSLQRAIDNMKHHMGYSTETGEALRYFLDHVAPTARQGVRSIVVVMTDGRASDKQELKAQSKRALDQGLEIFVIGIGGSIVADELQTIATDGEHVFIVSDYNALSDIQNRLTYEACGVKPQTVCSYSPIDVCFLVDASGSIDKTNFQIQKDFIKDFLKVFQINPSSARVAVATFSTYVDTKSTIPFDKYNTKKETLDAIDKLPHASRGTRTSIGIDYMVKTFVPGFRPHAEHILIVITDGKSEKPAATKQAAQKARAAGFTIVAVGVGDVEKKAAFKQELVDIAGDPSRVITPSNFKELNSFRDKLSKLVCQI